MKHLNCGVFFFWTHHSCPEFNRWGTAIRASLITCCFYWMLTGLLLLILKQMSWNILYFSLPERPQQKWITFVALDQILSEMKCDFPQAPLQPPGGGTKDEPAPSHPPTHFHCCQHCSRLRGRGRSEKRAFPGLGPLPPPGFPASHLSEGWHSKYKQPLSVSISTGSKLLGAPGVTDPEASTHDQGAVHPNSFTGAPREPLPAFQHCTPWGPCFQSSETAVLATQFLIPLARGLIQNSLPLEIKLPAFKDGVVLPPAQPLLLAGSPPPSQLSEPHRGGGSWGLTNSLGSAQFLSAWPGCKESGLILLSTSTVPLLLCRAQQTPTELDLFVCVFR